MIDIINKIYFIWPFIGIVIMVIVFFYDNKELEVKLDAVARFLTLIFIVMMVKIAVWNGQLIPVHSKIVSMRGFLFVFLEDAFFVMSPYYICKNIKSKYLKFAVWTLFSLLFGYGHIYLGFTWAAITLLYPYFISYNYAKKSSFATVMVCHFLYDCSVFLLPKINNLLATIK